MKNNNLILQKLSKSYHGQVVFSDLSLALSPGNAYCLMAPSGTGKTTLFRILMGLETPDSGTIDGLKNLKFTVCFLGGSAAGGLRCPDKSPFCVQAAPFRRRTFCLRCSPFAAKCPVPAGMRIFRRHEAPIVFAARPARSLRPFNFR